MRTLSTRVGSEFTQMMDFGNIYRVSAGPAGEIILWGEFGPRAVLQPREAAVVAKKLSALLRPKRRAAP